MHPTPRDATKILFEIAKYGHITTRKSLDNGLVLFVWGGAFLVDMIGFDFSHYLNSPIFGSLLILGFNALFLGWRLWYAQRLPVRLLKVRTNKIVLGWSFYYILLIGLGVGGWILLIGSYPPGWFSLLGVLGALPLFVAGGIVRYQNHKLPYLKNVEE